MSKPEVIRGVLENSPAPARLTSLCPIALWGGKKAAAGAAPAAAGGVGVEVGLRVGDRGREELMWGRNEGTVGHHLNLRCLPDRPNISLNIYIYITVYSFPACMHAHTHASTVCACMYTHTASMSIFATSFHASLAPVNALDGEVRDRHKQGEVNEVKTRKKNIV